MRRLWSKRLLSSVLAIFSGMLVTILLAREVGSMQSATTFAAQLTPGLMRQKDVWCWREICPELSSIVSAMQALAPSEGQVRQRYGNLYWESAAEPRWSAAVQVITAPPVVFYIQLMPPQTGSGYTLAEAMVQFGTPANVQVERDLNDWVIFVCFEHGVCGGLISQDLRLRPTQRLSIINLSRSGINLNTSQRAPGLYAWRGLARVRRR